MRAPFSLTKPRLIKRTADDSAATSLRRFIWRMTGYHQIAICLGAIAVTLINLVPIELQRRIVNEVVETQDVPMLLRLGAAYGALLLIHQAAKFTLRLYQSWLTESATLYMRNHLLSLYKDGSGEQDDGTGRAVSVVGTEVEKLGGFVGEALAQACANGAMLLGVSAYMLVVEPGIAVFALGVLVPQVVLTPVIQRRLNDLVEQRVKYLRELGDDISELDGPARDRCLTVIPNIFRNRMRYFLLKFIMKSLLNIVNAIGPMTVLLVGGYMVMQGETQVGVIVAFLSGFERMSNPVRELIGFYRVTAQAAVQHRMIARWMAQQCDDASESAESA